MEVLLLSKGIWSRIVLLRKLSKDWGSLKWEKGEILPHVEAVAPHTDTEFVGSVRKSMRIMASHPRKQRAPLGGVSPALPVRTKLKW